MQTGVCGACTITNQRLRFAWSSQLEQFWRIVAINLSNRWYRVRWSTWNCSLLYTSDDNIVTLINEPSTIWLDLSMLFYQILKKKKKMLYCDKFFYFKQIHCIYLFACLQPVYWVSSISFTSKWFVGKRHKSHSLWLAYGWDYTFIHCFHWKWQHQLTIGTFQFIRR